jgi:hypothetical protein
MTDDLKHRSAEPIPLRQAPRCGAKTRTGRPCRSPAVSGRPRCRMHGGARGSGGPPGKRNGNFRHGYFTAENVAERKAAREVIRQARKVLGPVR